MSTSTPASSAYHHGDLRAALVAAGLAILEEGGDPAALSLRETARRAGVSAMAPYRHFADKDALLAAVATIGFERLRAALVDADRAEGRREALIAQGVAYVGFACANPALFRLMFGTFAPDKPDCLGSAGEAAFSVMAGRVASLVPPEQVNDWALHCWAIAHGLAALSVDGRLKRGSDPPEQLAERLLGLSVIVSSASPAP